ncbi:hypothetical protein K525DRAFT_194596 [Schizophyllum commune Loenen D]|nr:hypothetical protein K525DRAFT_194596 [Schizophyllum commune Loenen D]
MSHQPEGTQEPEESTDSGAQQQQPPQPEQRQEQPHQQPQPAQETPAPQATQPTLAPTDYYQYVLASLPLMTREGSVFDQDALRRCLELSSSYLTTDTTTAPERGMQTWFTGFDRLADVVVALHGRGQLEVTTMSAASRACSECWSVAGSWRELAPCREGVRKIATRLKRLLDDNGKTYKGEAIYAP